MRPVLIEPTFAYSASPWHATAPQKIDYLGLLPIPSQYLLYLTNPSHVFDPSNPSEPKEVPEPENAEEWLSWFQKHPNLDISEPVSVRVGDLSGKQIDVTAS